jgi:ABC-2 type transport system permease protein
MNIFVRELRANLKSLIIWVVITILFIAVGFSKFSAYYNNPDMLGILKDLPQGVLSAMDLNSFNLTTVTGFLGIMYTYFALLLSIAAAMWGSDIISKEEGDKTVEFALTLPVKRSKLITAKTLAAVVNSFALLLVTGLITVASAQKYQPDREFYTFLFYILLAVFILQLVFLAVGIFLGCAMKQFRRAGSVAVWLLLATYFLSIIASLDAKLDFLKYFTPFKYFDPVALLHQNKLDILFVGLSAAIIAASMAGAYLSYSKRDLYI